MWNSDNLKAAILAIGGLGIFLIGMIIMTEGLKSLAGGSMRSALIRFTRSPLSGAATGAACTALLQSSSVTTVAAVGFVGAGLLSFPEALGIIFGANIGTTVTGWLVALLGFKFRLGVAVLPVILLGALLRLFTRDKVADFGFAMAGFGLIFIGISNMQQGMSGYQGILIPDKLASSGVLEILVLVGSGMLATIVTQSSSAGVAAVLTGLHGGAINFHQAAALVIGMDIGTTVTAVLATIGGAVGMRRTGLSHMIYNFFTGTGALLLIKPYVLTWEYCAPGQLVANPELALVGFHTAFNVTGVIIVLPFTRKFANFVEKIVPDRSATYTSGLDAVLVEQPDLALTAVQQSVEAEILALLQHAALLVKDGENTFGMDLPGLQRALNTTHEFLDRIHLNTVDGRHWERLIALTHTLDHLQRLHERFEDDQDRAVLARESDILLDPVNLLRDSLQKILENIRIGNWTRAATEAQNNSEKININTDKLRDTVIADMACGVYDVTYGSALLRAIRWLRRVSDHLSRTTFYFEKLRIAAGN